MVKETVKLWQCVMIVTVIVMTVMQVMGQMGPHGPRWPRYCTVQKKYNITKRVKYRAPTAVRTYEWCLNFPPRCSKWTTEMRDLTRLESEERVGEVEVCCPGFKYGAQGECEPFCGPGKTGQNCDEDCQTRYFGPSCSRYCDPRACVRGMCEHETGACVCEPGWEGQSCSVTVTTTTSTTTTTTTVATTTIGAPNTSVAPTVTVAPTTTVSRTTVPTTSTRSATTSMPSVYKIPSTMNVHPSTTRNVTPSLKDMSTITEINLKLNTENTKLTSPFSKYRTVIENVTKNNLPENSNLINSNKDIEISSSKSFGGTVPVTKDTVSTMNTKPVSVPTINQDLTSTVSVSVPSKIISTMTSEEIASTKTTSISETTRKPAANNKHHMTTKFKPKEIWIRPAQKGDSSIVDLKIKTTQDFLYKHKTSKELSSENSTTKTIIVSIIPTSVSSFKKIALSTASYLLPKTNISLKSTKTLSNAFTRPMTTQITTPYSTKSDVTNLIVNEDDPVVKHFSKSRSVMAIPSATTNRMGSSTDPLLRLNSSDTLITISVSPNISKLTEISTIETTQMLTLSTSTSRIVPVIDRYESTHKATTLKEHSTIDIPKITTNPFATKPLEKKQDVTNLMNVTNIITNPVTENPLKGAETFNILTEPEHITAVMSDKGSSRSSVDLVSVITIAGGVMMAIITVAVVIVMLERCRRPRYDEVRKYNDVSMNVIIDNHDVPPPPYVRSIFHTPLPEPPRSEKCHYQPISTLDRNLKQFMRPVVVQRISPIMLENFRGILECHYDHLPRRTPENVVKPTTPSVDKRCELLHQRSDTEMTIEALKCEARMDVIDNTTSEPLYAEIPCWRPPSEHAVEVVNLNGEAVTEL